MYVLNFFIWWHKFERKPKTRIEDWLRIVIRMKFENRLEHLKILDQTARVLWRKVVRVVSPREAGRILRVVLFVLLKRPYQLRRTAYTTHMNWIFKGE